MEVPAILGSSAAPGSSPGSRSRSCALEAVAATSLQADSRFCSSPGPASSPGSRSRHALEAVASTASLQADWKAQIISELKVYVNSLLQGVGNKNSDERKEEDSLVVERLPVVRAFSASLIAVMKDAIRPLYDKKDGGDQEFLGTIVFVTQEIAITCFHQVHDQGQILGESLRVDDRNVSHLVSYPYYDLSLYKCTGREGKFLQFGSTSSLAIGGEIHLASYPDLSNSSDAEIPFIVCSGTICGVDDNAVCGQYQCFPGCSGGAIVSKAGKLLGMHMESVFYQDEKTLEPPSWFYDCKPNEAVRGLFWSKGTNDEFLKEADPADHSLFAAQNVDHKGHLGSFLPSHVIRTKLQDEDIFSCRARAGKKRLHSDRVR